MRPEAMCRRQSRSRSRSGFTLVELLTVIGLIALLVSLFMPVLGKVRAAANSAGCASNLRQVGVAWTMYVAENHGRFPDFASLSSATPDFAWRSYWPGIAERAGVKGEALRCPAAREPSDRPHGYGTVSDAWNGRPFTNSSTLRMSDTTYRVSSYGYNYYLTAAGRFAPAGTVGTLNALSDPANTPALLDCAFAETKPMNRTSLPEPPPPNLRGDAVVDGSPEHWKFLLGRHGRGVNVYMADGSARWVRLEDTYLLTWNLRWTPYRLRLPAQ